MEDIWKKGEFGLLKMIICVDIIIINNYDRDCVGEIEIEAYMKIFKEWGGDLSDLSMIVIGRGCISFRVGGVF